MIGWQEADDSSLRVIGWQEADDSSQDGVHAALFSALVHLYSAHPEPTHRLDSRVVRTRLIERALRLKLYST